MKPLQAGELVEHGVWGRGKVLAVDHLNADVYFPSQMSTERGPVAKVRLEKVGRSNVQVDSAFDGVELKPKADGKVKASLPRRRKRPDQDLEKATAWFVEQYPGGFANETFVAKELTRKREAHQLFVDRIGGGRGSELLAAGDGEEAGRVLDAIWRHTTIPSRFEVNAAHDGLKDSAAAQRLLGDLLALLDAPRPDRFAKYSDAVRSLPQKSESSKVHTWPNVTLLPFLADPTRFMVLKPEVIKKAAGRAGRDLVYSTAIKWDAYERTIELSKSLLESLAPLGAKDFIDVQSFMWVTRDLP
jgi:hypothetical protein